MADALIRWTWLTVRWCGLAQFAALATALMGAAPAMAAEGAWASHDTVRARLVAAVEATGGLETVPAGLHLSLANGWKTYWRSPGDAGLPPSVDWSASENVAGVDFRWPAPHRFTLFGIETFGYAGDVVFPLRVRTERPGEPVALRGTADILVCSDVCIPVELDLTLDLPAGAPAPDPEAANLIARFEAAVPDDGSASGLRVEAAAAEAGKPGALRVRIASAEPLAAPDVLVESPDWTFGRPAFALSSDGRSATATLPIVSGPDAVTMPGSAATVTVTDGARAAETRITIADGTVRPGSWVGELLPVLGIALLGGLVLNLMPCVLPVLGLKLLSVIDRPSGERRRVRLGFLATAAGVLASMLALAAALAGLKAAGTAVGWGVQFQQPAFLVLMTAILVVFAANLMGALEIALPSRLATPLGRAGGDGLAGNFAAGAFATLLATPCSAPFVGTAVAFALARGPADILAIFAALGLGLAAPYLLVAARPQLAGLLPRPGRWIIALRRALAAALLGTAAWLLTVLAAQTSWQAAVATAAAMAILGAALALGRRLGPAFAALLAVVALSGAFAAPAVLRASPAANEEAARRWAPFDQAAIRSLVAQGMTVFVDVTAEWCVTCKVNKRLVLDSGEVTEAISGPGVIPMRADWTKPDPRISDYLSRHGRYGIPFNAVYGPGVPTGIVLPELLSRDAVLEALGRAKGGHAPPQSSPSGPEAWRQ